MTVIDVKSGMNPVNGTAGNDEINLKERVGNGIVINAAAGNDIITVTRGDNHVIKAGLRYHILALDRIISLAMT